MPKPVTIAEIRIPLTETGKYHEANYKSWVYINFLARKLKSGKFRSDIQIAIKIEGDPTIYSAAINKYAYDKFHKHLLLTAESFPDKNRHGYRVLRPDLLKVLKAYQKKRREEK